MSTPAPPDKAIERIQEALTAFQEAWYGGERPDLDRFCAAYPDCAPELRYRILNFMDVLEVLEGE